MRKHSIAVAALALVGLLAGCSSVMDRRISAHAETWRQLSEQDRHRLLAGSLHDGDTEEMARIAFGPPDKVLPAAGRNGEARTVWVYDLLDYETNYSDLDARRINHLRMPNEERRITFQDGHVVNRARDAGEIRRKMAAFRAKYDLPASFRLTDPAQVEEFRAILGWPPANSN